ncbi:MAG: hypothetical protein ACRD50_07325 [Candidatus Acidiferrales bacterium]
MISRLTFALSVALLGAALFATSASAQVRGMRGSGRARGTRASFRFSGRNRFAHRGQRGFFYGSGFYPYYDSDYEYEPVMAELPPPQAVVTPPPPPPVAAAPVEPVILEEHDGQWVRIPNGSQMSVAAQSPQPGSPRASRSRRGIAVTKEAAQPLELPPAMLVFRDGHQEEVAKYMIQGDALYTPADYWKTGSWTRKIPMADLDLPASLKLNAERGANFSLPSAPNEVVVRF